MLESRPNAIVFCDQPQLLITASRSSTFTAPSQVMSPSPHPPGKSMANEPTLVLSSSFGDAAGAYARSVTPPPVKFKPVLNGAKVAPASSDLKTPVVLSCMM